MNDILKYIFVNMGKIAGVVGAFILAVFLITLGIKKTLFIIAFIILGYLLGKWFDEGVSFKKFLKDVINSLRSSKRR